MTNIILDTDYAKKTLSLDTYVSEPITWGESRGELEDLKVHVECIAGRFGRLVQILYDKGDLDIGDIQEIVGNVTVSGGEFRGELEASND